MNTSTHPISLEYRRRFWTVCTLGKPIATFPSLECAVAAVPEAVVVHRLSQEKIS